MVKRGRVKPVKRGRPHKTGGSKEDKKIRQQWRKASAKHYKKNRKKILKKSKDKNKVKVRRKK